MRVIKFRVWSPFKEKMFPVLNIGLSGSNTVIVQYKPVVKLMLENCILEQFTGHTDRNGKEIYDGDIIVQMNDGFRYVIEWHRSSNIGCNGGEYGFDISGFVPARILSGTTKIDDHGNCEIAYCRLLEGDVEVIGNIHEKPELLK